MGMNDNLLTLIFINMSFVLPYSIWLLQAYFKTIPTELEDAARMDGCNRFQVANKIIIPLSIPGMTTAGILAFLLSWGEFLFALLITETEQSYTVPWSPPCLPMTSMSTTSPSSQQGCWP